MNETLPIIELKQHEGVHVVSTGNPYRIIAEGKDTDNRLSLMEAALELGQGAPFHTHSCEDESFYVIEGEVTFYLENREIRAKREHFVSFPPDAMHGFHNNTDKKARMLVFYSSAGAEENTLRDGQIVEFGVKAYDLNDGRAIQYPQLSVEYGITESDKELPTIINDDPAIQGKDHV